MTSLNDHGREDKESCPSVKIYTYMHTYSHLILHYRTIVSPTGCSRTVVCLSMNITSEINIKFLGARREKNVIACNKRRQSTFSSSAAVIHSPVVSLMIFKNNNTEQLVSLCGY